MSETYWHNNTLSYCSQAILKIHLLGEIAKLREDSAELGDRYEQDLLAFRDAGEQMERLAAQKSAGDKRIEELQEKLDTSKGNIIYLPCLCVGCWTGAVTSLEE